MAAAAAVSRRQQPGQGARRLRAVLLRGHHDRDGAGDARFLHGDAVEKLRRLHRPPVVRDQDELRLGGHHLQESAEADHVGFVEGGVHFVEQAERRRGVLEDGEEEGDGREGLLAAGEKGDALEPLPRRLRNDLESRLQDVLVRLPFHDQAEVGAAAAEERPEDLREPHADLLVGVQETLPRLPVDPDDGVPQ